MIKVMFLEAAWELANTHQSGLGFVHLHKSDSSKKSWPAHCIENAEGTG